MRVVDNFLSSKAVADARSQLPLSVLAGTAANRCGSWGYTLLPGDEADAGMRELRGMGERGAEGSLRACVACGDLEMRCDQKAGAATAQAGQRATAVVYLTGGGKLVFHHADGARPTIVQAFPGRLVMWGPDEQYSFQADSATALRAMIGPLEVDPAALQPSTPRHRRPSGRRGDASPAKSCRPRAQADALALADPVQGALQQRFPAVAPEAIGLALQRTKGHGGRAAQLLRSRGEAQAPAPTGGPRLEAPRLSSPPETRELSDGGTEAVVKGAVSKGPSEDDDAAFEALLAGLRWKHRYLLPAGGA